MVRQGQISDEFWAVVEPLLPTSEGRRGRPWADHRVILEGICWRYRTGSPWRDVPVDFGPRLLADKAYSRPSTRAALRRRRIGHTIPEKSDQIARRKAKGRAGGRPPVFDASAYKKRNVVERGYLHLKQWRGIATRYDKHARTFLGGVQLASTILHLKHHLEPVMN